MQNDTQQRIHLTAVARGDATADLLIRNALVVNVSSGEILPGNVAIAGDRIAYVGPRTRRAAHEIDAAGCYLAPGWIEPHSHPWQLYNPVSLAEAILPGGTTTVFNDNLFFMLHAGAAGFTHVLDAVRGIPVRYHWLVRLFAQSPFGSEAALFAPGNVLPLLDRPEVAGTAEVTRWPLVYEGNPTVLDGIARARALGKRSDGHTAGASYEKLNAVAAGGISACHEAISVSEILARLRLGFWTILRHSSLRRDVPVLARAITHERIDTRRLMLTVDGPAPCFIAEGGFIDEVLRQAVAAGVPPMTAIQMATINPATYYGMDHSIGGIAPGRLADLVFLPDLENFHPVRVLIGGRAPDPLPQVDWRGLGMGLEFGPSQPVWPAQGKLPVIEFIGNVITRGGGWSELQEGLLMAALLDTHGQWSARGLVGNFAPGLDAMASTYNTTAHLLVLGRDVAAMERAADAVRRMGGGIAFANRDGVQYEFPLPITGVMSPEPFAATVEAQRQIERRLRAAGFRYGDVLYALLFLTCDFLPGWRLTAQGVYDVRRRELVTERSPG